jgi:hypothetical protein
LQRQFLFRHGTVRFGHHEMNVAVKFAFRLGGGLGAAMAGRFSASFFAIPSNP